MVIKRKTLMWMLVMWFAVLQTITPFIHAHLEADQPQQAQGLHMHEFGLLDLPDMEHTLKNVDAPMHIVGVNQAVVKNVDLMPLPLFSLLFVLSLPLLICQRVKPSLTRHNLLPIYLRASSRPRAPPL